MADLYDISVPVFLRGLRNLDHVLAKAVESGIAEATLIEARLIADMFPFPRQVQIACDIAKLAVMRLAQTEAAPMADEETTFAQLRERIAKTITYIEAADRAAFAGRETATITMELPSVKLDFTGLSFLTDFALPNFYFHLSTAYGLLRMKGVSIGKLDFLAGGVMPG